MYSRTQRQDTLQRLGLTVYSNRSHVKPDVQLCLWGSAIAAQGLLCFWLIGHVLFSG